LYICIVVRPTLELNSIAFLNDVTRRTVIDFRKAFFIYNSMEIWKKINGYNDYEISDKGIVKSCKYGKETILKLECNKGYLRVSLCKNNITKRFQVHRLVASHFLNNRYNKPCVNHKDGNKLNNSVANLEWVTYSENEIHSYKCLNKINPIRKLNDIAISDILKNCVKGLNQNNKGNVIEFMNKYNVDRKTILNVLNKKYYV
jgi:hypothetical protein